jgi:molecular chaperone DnaK (HSP70)
MHATLWSSIRHT